MSGSFNASVVSGSVSGSVVFISCSQQEMDLRQMLMSVSTMLTVHGCMRYVMKCVVGKPFKCHISFSSLSIIVCF